MFLMYSIFLAFSCLSEWYSWHFPELIKIVNDNILYARLVRLIGMHSPTLVFPS
jgi:RNA processing factor Prp31